MPSASSAASMPQPVQIAEMPAQVMLEIICADQPALARALAPTIALPDRPMTATATDAATVLALAPGRWLLCFRGPPGSDLEADWAPRLRPAGGSVVDVSQGWRRFAIGGASARDLLAKGLAIDLQPMHFGPGDCRQTLFARVPAIVHAAGVNEFQLFVAASYADWAGDWLRDAAVEFEHDGKPSRGAQDDPSHPA